MIVRTCLSSVSEHGKKMSELKSGICKYMRRGEAEKMKWCVMEIAAFQRAGGDERAIKGLVTNLVNRLKILLMEEIHANDVGILKTGLHLLQTYDENRDKTELLLTFCDVVAQARRTRTVSYLNNWWRYHEVDTTAEIAWEGKKGDSDEVIRLGSYLEKFVSEKDERMFGIFQELYQMSENGEKAGLRFRRRDPTYVWWEILEKHLDPSLKPLFDFALQMFFRKGLTERRAFGAWIGVLVWSSETHTENPEMLETVYTSKDAEEYYEEMGDLTLDEYVVKDYHVDKSLGLAHFAHNGAWVKDEDLSLLNRGQVDGKEYREFYIEKKIIAEETRKKAPKAPKAQKAKKAPKAQKVPKRGIPSVPKLLFAELSDVVVIEEGVCGGKVPCIVASYEGQKCVLKMVGESMNYGADYIIIDKAKSMFGLRDMNMKRVCMNRVIRRKDPKIKTFVGNWEFGLGEAIYCMMDYFENVGDVGKNKGFLGDETVVRECLKIRLYDGLFRSSDNIMRNILVNNSGELLSIDEGDMFGKRKLVFNRRGDWCKKNVSAEILQSVLEEILENKEEKVKGVQNLMLGYRLDYASEFKARFENYREIVQSEW